MISSRSWVRRDLGAMGRESTLVWVGSLLGGMERDGGEGKREREVGGASGT